MERIDSQKSRIRAWLNEGKSITPIEALAMFGCFRLSAVIFNLKNDGMRIKTERVIINDKNFARYSKE